MKYPNTIKWFLNERTAVGMSQNEISLKLGYKSGQLLSNFERGTCKLPYKKLSKIVQIIKADKEGLKRALLKDYKLFLKDVIGEE